MEHLKIERDDISERLISEREMSTKMLSAINMGQGNDAEFEQKARILQNQLDEQRIQFETTITALNSKLELKEHQMKEIENESKKEDNSLGLNIKRLQDKIAEQDEIILSLETENKQHKLQIEADFQD